MGKDLTRQRTQDREQEAWRLRVAGFSQWQIAEKLDISQPAVSKILARVGKRLAEEFLEEVRSVKMAQTETLERIMAESLAAWQRSKQDAQTLATVHGRTTVKDGEVIALPDQITQTVTGQSGNPAHLAQARGALADIRSLWGLDAPQRQEHSGPGGAAIPLFSEIVVELPAAVPVRPAIAPETAGDADSVSPLPPGANGAGGLEVIVELPG